MHCEVNSCFKILEFAPIEASIFIDNLVSNTVKSNAQHFDITFKNKRDVICMIVSDDGDGLSSKLTDPSSIFEKGITTSDGSGLGLYNVASFVRNVMKGTIDVDKSNNKKGFKLFINF